MTRLTEIQINKETLKELQNGIKEEISNSIAPLIKKECFYHGKEIKELKKSVNEIKIFLFQNKKLALKQELIVGYKESAKNQKLQKELEIWDETVDDVLEIIDQKKNE